MKTYKYRGYPCNVVETSQLWEVSGTDTLGGGGVLEWCVDKSDALYMLGKMRKYPQFRNLTAQKHSED